jgi:hypothetical protein
MSNETSSSKRLGKRRIGIASVAVVLGLLLGATILAPNLAGAQESTTSTTVPEDEATAEASAGAIAGKPDPQTRIRAALDGLVADGTITGAQADAVAAALAGQLPERGRRWHRIHFGLDVASTAIGITEAELREALAGGQTIAEVAEANGVSAQTVIDALVTAVNAKVDEAVAAGNLTEDEAAEIKANAVERATNIVNGEWPPPFPGRPAADSEA